MNTPEERETQRNSKAMNAVKEQEAENACPTKEKKGAGCFLKKLAAGLLSNIVFWILMLLSSLILFINVFERYTSFGVDRVYRLF